MPETRLYQMEITDRYAIKIVIKLIMVNLAWVVQKLRLAIRDPTE
jgi:hypothetical protein